MGCVSFFSHQHYLHLFTFPNTGSVTTLSPSPPYILLLSIMTNYMCISNPTTDFPSGQPNVTPDNNKYAIPIRLIRDATTRPATSLNCYFLQIRANQKKKEKRSFNASEEITLARLWYETVYSKSELPRTGEHFEKTAVDVLNSHKRRGTKRFTIWQVRSHLQTMINSHRYILISAFLESSKKPHDHHVPFYPNLSAFHTMYGYLKCERIIPQTTKKFLGRKRWDTVAQFKHLKLELECPHHGSEPAHFIVEVEPSNLASSGHSQSCRGFTTADDVIIIEHWDRHNSSCHGQTRLALEKYIAKYLNALPQYQHAETETFFSGIQVHLRLVHLLKTYRNILDEWDSLGKSKWITLKHQEFMDFGSVFRFLGDVELSCNTV